MCVLFGFHLVYFGTGSEVSLLLLYWTAVLGVRPLKMALYSIMALYFMCIQYGVSVRPLMAYVYMVSPFMMAL